MKKNFGKLLASFAFICFFSFSGYAQTESTALNNNSTSNIRIINTPTEAAATPKMVATVLAVSFTNQLTAPPASAIVSLKPDPIARSSAKKKEN